MLSGAVAAVLAALIEAVPAEAAPRSWSIVAHFLYQDGFEYDYVMRTGVSTKDMASMLADCGASHWTQA